MTEIRKRRASGAPDVRFGAEPVDRDGVGTWLLEGSTPHIHDDEGWVVFVSPNPVLVLVPDTGGWVAWTTHAGAKIDLCRDITVGPDHVEFVDIELDLVWRWGENARIEDLDEFEALSLPSAEADRHLSAAERLRVQVDAGLGPFGSAFRLRLVDLTGAPDPRLRSTWAGAVGPLLAPEVANLVGNEWLNRQRSGAGWLLCGGGDAVAGVVWVDAGGGGTVLTAVATPEGQAMESYLMAVAPSLSSYPPPPLAC